MIVAMLIEHLHKVQDRFGHLSAAHLAALAEEMGLAQAEVYEVASFYHHFDVVKEGEAAPPRLTVRVCDTLSCRWPARDELLERLPAAAGAERARAWPRPASAAASRRRRSCVGQNALGTCDAPRRWPAPSRRAHAGPLPRTIGYAAYRKAAATALLAIACVAGKRDADR
jgi:hypothetical protein